MRPAALFVAVDEKPAGIIAVADPIKPTTMAALDALRSEGIRIVMLAGDNRTTAQAGIIGTLGSGSSPSTTCKSVRHTPHAAIFTRISPGPGCR